MSCYVPPHFCLTGFKKYTILTDQYKTISLCSSVLHAHTCSECLLPSLLECSDNDISECSGDDVIWLPLAFLLQRMPVNSPGKTWLKSYKATQGVTDRARLCKRRERERETERDSLWLHWDRPLVPVTSSRVLLLTAVFIDCEFALRLPCMADNE